MPCSDGGGVQEGGSGGSGGVPPAQRLLLGLIAPTLTRSPAGRHGDWCCRCRSSACWSSWPPPAAVAACSSATDRQERALIGG